MSPTCGAGQLPFRGMKGPLGGRRRRAAAAAAASILVLLASVCGGSAKPAAVKSTSKPLTSTSRAATSTTADKKPVKTHPAQKRSGTRKAVSGRPNRGTRRPLTGLEPPGGQVPKRAALAVKVENLPQARPRWGLDKADIVFEEPVEGGITRFIAVFQCQNADRIELFVRPVWLTRSILEPLGRMLIAYSGAIQPAIGEIDSKTSLLSDLSDNWASSAYWTDPTRYAPHNLVTSTSASLCGGCFALSREATDTDLQLRAASARRLPGCGRQPQLPPRRDQLDLAQGRGPLVPVLFGHWARHDGRRAQVTASNVVVMSCWSTRPRHGKRHRRARDDLALKGTGPAFVFRDGTVFYGHWERPLLDPGGFIDSKSGATITLTPGNTWEELVPYGENVTVTP